MTTATKTEKPILFSTELVQAILDGRKSQTRRVIKNAPDVILDVQGRSALGGYEPGEEMQMLEEIYEIKCPYNADELWVRETFYFYYGHDEKPPSECPKDLVWYETDPQMIEDDADLIGRKRASIHMPRWASRIQLTVEDIRVERVQEISEEDSIAEGVNKLAEPSMWEDYAGGLGVCETAVASFQSLWDSINAKPKPVKVDGEIHHYESFPWEDIQETREHRGKPWHIFGNPYVWVVHFSIKNIKGA